MSHALHQLLQDAARFLLPARHRVSVTEPDDRGAERINFLQTVDSNLGNTSTRGFIDTADNVMIGGVIVGNSTADVLIRAIGPSLSTAGVNDALADPTLELFVGNGTMLGANDDWRSDQEAEIAVTTIPPNVRSQRSSAPSAPAPTPRSCAGG